MHVLLVDDDLTVLRMMTGWLTFAGHEVVPCTTFESAKRALATETPDLLVTDVRLGAFNGLQLVVLAKVDHPEMRAIVLTGYDDPVLREEATATGASFLVKPIDAQRFLDSVSGTPGHGTT